MIKNFGKIILTLALCITTITFVAAQEPSDSEDSVREKVKEKIENALNRPKAYLGTITDKTADTLQIKNTSGEIQFIEVDTDNTSFISTGKTTKTVKYEDIALGDFIIAMGYIFTENTSNTNNGNRVLEAKRIIVTDEVEPTDREVVFGNVIGIENKILSLNSDGRENKYEFPKRWKGPEIDEIDENDKVAIVSYKDENKTYIRTIEVLSNNSTSVESQN